MRITNKELNDRLEFLNGYTKDKNIFYNIRKANGWYYLDQNNNCIFAGSKREVFEHLYTVLNVFWCLYDVNRIK